MQHLGFSTWHDADRAATAGALGALTRGVAGGSSDGPERAARAFGRPGGFKVVPICQSRGEPATHKLTPGWCRKFRFNR